MRLIAVCVAALAATLGFALHTVRAQEVDYVENKTFKITPLANVANPKGAMQDFQHAWWQQGGSGGAVYTTPQNDPGFTGFGYEFYENQPAGPPLLKNTNKIPNLKNGTIATGASNVPATLQTTPIPANGFNGGYIAEAGPLGVATHAKADTAFNIGALADKPFHAFVAISGKIDKAPTMTTYAFSGGKVAYQGTIADLNGAKVGSVPVMGRAGTQYANLSSIWDPVSFDMLDSSDNVLSSSLVMNFQIATEGDADVSVDADTGAVHLQTSGDATAALHLVIDSQYVLPNQGGMIDLEIVGGFVTESSASGRFAGKLLPSLNSPTSTWDSLTLTEADLTFDLNLLSHIPVGATQVAIITDNGLFVTVPEPGALCLLGCGAAVVLARRSRTLRPKQEHGT